MTIQQIKSAPIGQNDSRDRAGGLRVLNTLVLFLSVVNLVGLAALALSRPRFEEIQMGISDNSVYLFDSWFAEYLVRPGALVFFGVLFVLLLIKERLIHSVSNRLFLSLFFWIVSGVMVFFVISSLYSF